MASNCWSSLPGSLHYFCVSTDSDGDGKMHAGRPGTKTYSVDHQISIWSLLISGPWSLLSTKWGFHEDSQREKPRRVQSTMPTEASRKGPQPSTRCTGRRSYQDLSPLCALCPQFQVWFKHGHLCLFCLFACQQEEPNVQAPTNVIGAEMAFPGHLLEDICFGLLSTEWSNHGNHAQLLITYQPITWACSPLDLLKWDIGFCAIKMLDFRVSPNDSLARVLTTTAITVPVCQWQAGQTDSEPAGTWKETAFAQPSSQRDVHIKCQMRQNEWM